MPLQERKGDQKRLVDDAAGACAIYSILFQFLTEECLSYQHSSASYHQYLSKEPAFVRQ